MAVTSREFLLVYFSPNYVFVSLSLLQVACKAQIYICVCVSLLSICIEMVSMHYVRDGIYAHRKAHPISQNFPNVASVFALSLLKC